jgi:hypothetical protein
MRSREEKIKELINIKMKEQEKLYGYESLMKRYNDHYEKCSSDAEYEVDIGAYK